jgi:hypothetical protein
MLKLPSGNKSKGKSKRKWVWCTTKSIGLDFHMGEREGNKIVPLRGFRDIGYKIPTKVRCPECNKAFKPRVRECHDHNCWHIDIPPHKKWIKDVK